MPTAHELWNSRDESVWLQALDQYWRYVKPRLLSIETELASLDRESVRRMGMQECYDFLFYKYFPWKYTAANRLATTRRHLKRYMETGSLAELFQIKEQIFAFNLENIREGLTIVSQIRGLGIS